jgi:hypothetical protein
VVSACGEIRSTGAVNCRSARSTPAYLVAMHVL